MTISKAPPRLEIPPPDKPELLIRAQLVRCSTHDGLSSSDESPESPAPAPVLAALHPRVSRLDAEFDARFKLLEEIGSGFFGHVRRGYDTKTCDFVAVKLVVTTGEGNFTGGERGVDLLRRVLTEVRVMQALGSHPHICGYIGTYALRTRLAIVMEYVRGGDLFHFLDRWGPLSEPDAAHCMRHLLTGLQYMHSKGIAHRDVKLENILVSGDPSMGDIKQCFLKLVDFNLSSAPPQRRGHSSDTEAIINSLTGGSSPVGGGGATQASFESPVAVPHTVSTSITAEDTPDTARPGTPTSTLTCMTAFDCSPAALVAMHSHVGSLYYAAPCVYAATPKKGYGLKCDIWSSGVCCYSCLMNCFPFTESTEKKLCDRIVNGPHAVNFDIVPHGRQPLSALARRFINLLLTPNADRRPTAEAALAHPWLADAVLAHGSHESLSSMATDGGSDGDLAPLGESPSRGSFSPATPLRGHRAVRKWSIVKQCTSTQESPRDTDMPQSPEADAPPSSNGPGSVGSVAPDSVSVALHIACDIGDQPLVPPVPAQQASDPSATGNAPAAPCSRLMRLWGAIVARFACVQHQHDS